jgi:multisubunit Na+/H+ antiporter MnhG subunit
MRMPRMPNLVARRMLFATVVETTGVGIILFGLWVLHPIAAIIGLGSACIFIAQGLQRGGTE